MSDNANWLIAPSVVTIQYPGAVRSDSESDVTYGQVRWPILGNRALQLTLKKCTHTAVNTHTHTPWSHTRSSGQPFMLRCLGSSWGFGALFKGTSVMVLKVEKALDIHSTTYNSCRPEDSSSQPFDYKSESLSYRPRLPPDKPPDKKNESPFHAFKSPQKIICHW